MADGSPGKLGDGHQDSDQRAKQGDGADRPPDTADQPLVHLIEPFMYIIEPFIYFAEPLVKTGFHSIESLVELILAFVQAGDVAFNHFHIERQPLQFLSGHGLVQQMGRSCEACSPSLSRMLCGMVTAIIVNVKTVKIQDTDFWP